MPIVFDLLHQLPLKLMLDGVSRVTQKHTVNYTKQNKFITIIICSHFMNQERYIH